MGNEYLSREINSSIESPPNKLANNSKVYSFPFLKYSFSICLFLIFINTNKKIDKSVKVKNSIMKIPQPFDLQIDKYKLLPFFRMKRE